MKLLHSIGVSTLFLVFATTGIAQTSAGVITTVAGRESRSLGGDGGKATAAGLSVPHGIAVDRLGNLFNRWPILR